MAELVTVDALRQIVEEIMLRIRKLESLEQEPGLFEQSYCSADSILPPTPDYTDITGCTIAVTPGIYVVVGVFDFLSSNDDLDNGYYGEGVLDIVGVQEQAKAVAPIGRVTTATGAYVLRITVAQAWAVNIPTAGSVLKLRARKTGGTGSTTIKQFNTTITAYRIAVIGT